MHEKFIRIYQKLDVRRIRDHMLIYGDLSASCSKCKELDIKLDATACSNCHTEFHYISFRNVKQYLPKLLKIAETRPNIVLVDYEDYTRLVGALKAEEFLK